jgi:lipoprotein signal peptidase
MIGFSALCGGIVVLLVVLFVHFTFPKQSNEYVELNLIIGGAIAIIVGLFIIKSKRK